VKEKLKIGLGNLPADHRRSQRAACPIFACSPSQSDASPNHILKAAYINGFPTLRAKACYRAAHFVNGTAYN